MKSLKDQIKEISEKQNEHDEINATVILNQMEIITKQEENDAVLAEILLNGLGV